MASAMMYSSTQRIAIHQYHYTAAKADAVTNQMFFLRNALREAGIESEIFADKIKGLPEGEVHKGTSHSIWNCDLLLVHHSQGNPRLQSLLAIEVPKALVYHNITPSEFFRHDPYLASLCDIGRKQLRGMRREMVASFADSHYNAKELMEVGYSQPEILPLFDLKALVEAEPRPVLPISENRPLHLLFVGKLTPHKNQAQVLKVLYYLRRQLKRECRLTLVGGTDPLYGSYLKLLSRALGLAPYVKFAGRVSDETRALYYQSADIFLCVSLHEGFCIPLVEAMVAGIPIVANPKTGVRETLGGAGLEVYSDEPEVVAECIAGLVDHPECRDAVLKSQHVRLEEMRQLQNRERALRLVVDLVERLRHPLPKSGVQPSTVSHS